jgi:pseudouridine-5'-phosphate glycosidase/pseudouridine kinase
VGIDVFVTGGIGGVHRGAAESFDVSPDLTTLARPLGSVVVVCAGVKSILDIPKTLEFLETHSVPVVTYGPPNTEFPAFFSPSSGVPSPHCATDLSWVARHLLLQRTMGLGGLLLAVPSPTSAGEEVQIAILQAVKEAEQKGVAGQAVTPFVLARVAELTKGASLAVNVALVKNNAKIGAALAVEMAEAKRQVRAAGGVVSVCGKEQRRSFHSTPRPRSAQVLGRPVIVGGAVADMLARADAARPYTPCASNPGQVTQSFGGVGRNIAEVLARLAAAQGVCESQGADASLASLPPVFVTALGADSVGASLTDYCTSPELGINLLNVHSAAPPVPSGAAMRSAAYSALLDEKGELVGAIADMEIFDSITPEALTAASVLTPQGPRSFLSLLQHAPVVVCDANLPARTLGFVARSAAMSPTVTELECDDDALAMRETNSVPFAFEPISVAKCGKIVEADALHLVTIAKPNKYEVVELARLVRTRMGLPQEDARIVGDEAADEAKSEATAAAAAAAAAGVGEVDLDLGAADITGDSGISTSPATMARETTGLDDNGEARRSTSIDFSNRSVSIDETGNAPASTASAADEAGEEDDLDYRILEASKAVLAAMCRPGGLAVPVSQKSVDKAEQILQHFASGVAVERSIPVRHQNKKGSNSLKEKGDYNLLDCDPAFPGGLVEDRKHLLVTLGSLGVLWLSAVPPPTNELADQFAVMPFFAAARHPDLEFDFKLCRAPTAKAVKCTGAGDTFFGSTLSGLQKGLSMASAIRVGLAGAKIAVETPTGRGKSTISNQLSFQNITKVTQECVPEVDEEYA